MDQIIVLGSEGFIGNHLVRHFLEGGYSVSGCDLFETSLHGRYKYFKVSRLSPEWEEVFSGQKFAYCINAAGSGNVPYSMTHPFSDFEANTLDTIRILDAIRRHNPDCRYLHISSAAVYGNPRNLPISESDEKKPLSPYGWHKLMAEQVCNEYYTVYGLKIALIRPFSVYGEGLRKQLLWDICEKLRQSDNISLFGTGGESRDFIHVSDLALLIDCIVRRSAFDYEIFNAASGKETRISEIADVFMQYYEGRKKIGFSGEARSGDPINWVADIQKASAIGFEPHILLSGGIRKYIEWYHSATD
jgi:UDP-glucose 4-epimerase